MKLAVLALTKGGAETAFRLAEKLPGKELNGGRPGVYRSSRVGEVKVFLPQKLGALVPAGELYAGPTAGLIAEIFHRFDGLVLIMAAGIGMRALAPLLQGKDRDPAVVLVDEKGRFAVSLLSGHLGGANDLARSVAAVLQGTPVITTSTDVQGRLAVDVLARDLGAKIEPVEGIVRVNSALARGDRVTLLCDRVLPLGKDHPLFQDPCWEVVTAAGDMSEQARELGVKGEPVVVLTSRTGPGGVLSLRPPTIVAGVGCRRGTTEEAVIEALRDAMAQAGQSVLSLKKISSIEGKSAEEGILRAAESLGVDTEFYPAGVLAGILSERPGLARSEFVYEQMGVGGVCEPASLAGCRQGRLILGKQARQGVTVALAEEESGW